MRRVALLVLDGAGLSDDPTGNAVTAATLPAVFAAMARHGHATLAAAGPAVGLEPGQVGNSEVGHLTIGAGRAVPSMTCRLARAFESGEWAADPMWAEVARRGVLHLVGLLSDAGVHALVRTIEHAASIASGAGVPEILVHPILDGVDSRAGSAPDLLAGLEERLAALPRVRIGVVQGRKGFCDRSGDLAPSRAAVDALRGRVALPPFARAELAAHVAAASEKDFPPRLAAGGRPIAAGETVLVTNHRADRIRQVVRVLAETQRVLTIVDPGEGCAPERVFFPAERVTDGLAAALRGAGIRSARIAEKCKFPHVTHFLNGFDAAAEGKGTCLPSIPEHEIAAKPEMSIAAVTEAILRTLEDPAERVLVANICNLDQVGHLGRLDLAIIAAREVDRAFASIARTAERHGWTVLVTSDHGNADCVEDAAGAPFGSHTDRPVPCFAIPAPRLRAEWRAREGTLANVAATCLAALGLAIPEHWEPPLLGFSVAAGVQGRVGSSSS